MNFHRVSMASPWVRTLVASTSSAVLFFSYAAFADTESRSSLVAVAALATALVSMTIAVYSVLLTPRLGRLLAAAVCALGVFTAAATAAWLSPVCPAADGPQRCSVPQGVAAGFSVMLLVPVSIGVVFLGAVSVRLARALVAVFRKYAFRSTKNTT